MTTKIIGNQIDAATRAIVTALQVTEQINLPILNQTQINALGTVPLGTMVFNSTEGMFQGYLPDVVGPGTPGWDDVGGGGPSLGEDSIIRTNGTTISENVTIGPSANNGAEFTNGFSAAPITISNGYTVTIEDGATWTLIGTDEDISTYRYFDNAAVNSHLRIVTGATFEFGQTKERSVAFAKSGTVALDHSQATIFTTSNPTGFNGNFVVNFINVPSIAGFVYTAQVIVHQTNGNGYITGAQINGQTADMYMTSAFSNGEWDVFNFFFYLDGASWKVFGSQSRYSAA
jgi:hypothetical protein